jgi:predicted GH43/DUF377 family glycosyl hydrolase
MVRKRQTACFEEKKVEQGPVQVVTSVSWLISYYTLGKNEVSTVMGIRTKKR